MVLDNLHEGFTTVSVDESFFFFDSLVKRVWIYKDSRPVVTITGSHTNLSMFGAISLKGKQLFRIVERFNEDTFYEFLKQIHYKFPKCYLFLDKAPQHHRSRKIRKYFEEHKDSLIPVYLPAVSPELMVLEECRNIYKDYLLSISIDRFPDSYHLCSYDGLVPSTSCSGGPISWPHYKDGSKCPIT